MRRNEDVEWYNKIAVEALAEEGVIIIKKKNYICDNKVWKCEESRDSLEE